jgi:hypothetical protein
MNLYETLLGVPSRRRPNAVPAERADEYEQLKSTLWTRAFAAQGGQA